MGMICVQWGMATRLLSTIYGYDMRAVGDGDSTPHSLSFSVCSKWPPILLGLGLGVGLRLEVSVGVSVGARVRVRAL